MTSTTPDGEAPETPVRRGPKLPGEQRDSKRLTGEERRKKAVVLARAYNQDRVSIRFLVAEHDMSYGLVHTLLREQNVTFRGRGGTRSTRSAR